MSQSFSNLRDTQGARLAEISQPGAFLAGERSVDEDLSPSPGNPSSIRILRLPDVMNRVGLRRASIYLLLSKGLFPKQISLGPRAVGWIEHEIDAWLLERISARK